MATRNSPKQIILDIVGTLVSYEHFFDVIDQRLGTSLKAHDIFPRLLGFAWLESAEREYTYLSLSGRYAPFARVFHAIFFQILHLAGVADLRNFASEEDVEYFMQEYRDCTVRTGAKECIDRLKDAGLTVWAFTSGDRERVQSYFSKGKVAIDNKHVVTCDEAGAGKPEIKAYERVKEKMGIRKDDIMWFAAAHGWDVSAAGRTVFKTAYCTVLEKEPLEDIFVRLVE